MQAIIHPPPIPKAPEPEPKKSRSFRTQGQYDELGSQRKPSSKDEPDWRRLAHAQLLRRQLDVCNALIVFAELDKQDSLADRIMLYPKSWDDGRWEEGATSPSELETSLRLIQQASQRYDVSLMPIDPIIQSDDLELAYPLEGLLSFTSYDRILVLPTPGLLLNASLADSLLLKKATSAFDTSSISTVLQPNKGSYQVAVAGLRASAQTSALELKSHSQKPLLQRVSRSMDPTILRASSLSHPKEFSNVTEAWEQAAYINLDDFEHEGIGPEYDIPRSMMQAARPKQAEMRDIWDDVYESYRVRRMNVCGLDLEPMPIKKEKESKDSV